MKAIYDKLEQATVRMETVILLAGMLNDGEAMPEPLELFLEETEDKHLQRCFPDIPPRLLALRDEDEAWFKEEFCAWANNHNKWGFVIQFATPVMTHSKGARGTPISSYSWGYYNTEWLYGDTVEAAVERALEWAKERRKAEIPPPTFTVGDIVASTDPGYPLRSGGEEYADAVVVQVTPRLVLVSRRADMRWESTVNADKLKVTGKAKPMQLAKCLGRL